MDQVLGGDRHITSINNNEPLCFAARLSSLPSAGGWKSRGDLASPAQSDAGDPAVDRQTDHFSRASRPLDAATSLLATRTAFGNLCTPDSSVGRHRRARRLARGGGWAVVGGGGAHTGGHHRRCTTSVIRGKRANRHRPGGGPPWVASAHTRRQARPWEDTVLRSASQTARVTVTREQAGHAPDIAGDTTKAHKPPSPGSCGGEGDLGSAACNHSLPTRLCRAGNKTTETGWYGMTDGRTSYHPAQR